MVEVHEDVARVLLMSRVRGSCTDYQVFALLWGDLSSISERYP